MFERGFKTWCEKYSAEVREDLKIAKDAPLNARALAAKLGVRVWTPHEVPGLSSETLDVLLRKVAVQ